MRLHVIGLLCAAACALGGCRSAKVAGSPCTFEFPFMNNYDVVNRVSFKWDDSYVTNNPAVYRQELAGPMSALAASTYGYRLFTDVRSFMDLGFPPERLRRQYGRDLSYKHPKYGRDRVGYTIASRRSELPGAEYDIVFVALRGTFGRDEWLSNVNMANEWGKSAELDPAKLPKLHEGFRKAADDVCEALSAYAKEFGIDLATAKILVTGHSRGGAVANVIGQRLDDAEDGPKAEPFAAVKRENVFVYTFASPNVTVRETPEAHCERYRNLFNVISPEDMVPTLPLEQWNGARFGRDLRLKGFNDLWPGGSFLDGGYCGMKDSFKEICGYEYYHMLFGTNLTARLPAFAGRIAPSITHFYWVSPEMRAEGNLTSTHSFLETVLWKNLPDAQTQAEDITLSGDVRTLTKTYDRLTNSEISEDGPVRKLDHKLRFATLRDDDGPFDPDGRDFSRQPDFLDVAWKFTCMHATQTYVAWMKSGERHGPDAIYANWDDFAGDGE